MLSLRIHTLRSSSVAPLHVTGTDNEMADTVSSAFTEGKYFFAFNNLITYFNIHFPLPYNESWRKCNITTKWVSQVIACLRGNKLQLAWLKRLPNIAKNNGIFGVTTPIYAKSILSSPTSLAPSNVMLLLQYLLLGSGQVCPKKRYNQSSMSHVRSCVHLQYHPIGWKTKPHLQVRRQIPSDHLVYG